MPATVAMTLDLRGLTVALPVARTAVAMAGLESGELIEVLTSDPNSVRDLPVWARATGNRLVEQTQGRGWYRFVLQKREGRPGGYRDAVRSYLNAQGSAPRPASTHPSCSIRRRRS